MDAKTLGDVLRLLSHAEALVGNSAQLPGRTLLMSRFGGDRWNWRGTVNGLRDLGLVHIVPSRGIFVNPSLARGIRDLRLILSQEDMQQRLLELSGEEEDQEPSPTKKKKKKKRGRHRSGDPSVPRSNHQRKQAHPVRSPVR